MVKSLTNKLGLNIYMCIYIIVAFLAVILISTGSASALTSQSTTGFQFSFNSSLSMTLSSSDLIISHLTPGNYASSNTISVNVSTNNRTGYTLVAKVGDKTSSTLNNNNLVNTTSDANFTSLATTDNIALANFGDGKWGYTVAPSIASATTYSGLLYNADTIINATRNVAGDPQEGYLGSNSTSFTIGAKAGQAQASGEYTNVINFRGVANVVPDIVMQETNLSELAAVMPNTGDTAMFVDNRDGTRYMVGKLADGKYWMLENLALGSDTAITLTNANTNMTAASWTLPASTTTGFDSSTGYTTAAINTASKTITQPLAAGQSGTGKVGVYYNYCAATVGTYCYAYDSGTADASKDNDICPKNWRMPTGGSSGEYQALYTAYSSSAANFAAALKTPLSGRFDYDGSAYGRGEYGDFWSSTRRNGTFMYNLFVNTASVTPQGSYYRMTGFSVRCVYNPTMQEVTASNLASMMANDGDTAILRDGRDGKSYTIGKINGQYWMTQNLDLAGGTTLTPANSNVSSNYTLPSSSTSGFNDDTKAFVYNSGSTTCSNNSPCYSYYSYVAATAGTNPSSGNATSDICPKGWRLPTQAEYNTLISTYTTGDDLTASPWLGVYAGSYSNGSFNVGGSDGIYWSSTASNSSVAYDLYFYSSGAYVLDGGKRDGDSVRCVKIPAMQDVTSSQLSTMMPNAGDTTVLKDTRDDKKYTISKLADGNYWMLENLALDPADLKTNVALTIDNTNMSASTPFILPASVNNFGSYTNPQINTDSEYTNAFLAVDQTSTGKIGVHYNYCAATAGTYCMDGSSGSGNANYDICPKGWRMPTGGASGEFLALRNSYSSDSDFVSALKIVLSGYFDDSIHNLNVSGYLWTSTYESVSKNYYMYTNVSNNTLHIRPQQNSSDRTSGLSVRCIKK